MKILVLVHDFRGGGAEKVATRLANQLSFEHEVHVAYTSEDGPCFSLLSEKIKCIDLSARRVMFSIPNLIKIIKFGSYDMIISHLTHVNVSAILACVVARYCKRLVVVEHSQMYENYRKQKNLLMKAIYLSTKLLYRFPRAIVGVSDGVCDAVSKFARIKREKITTIYNPIIDSFCEKKIDVPDHPFLKIKNKPVFVFVGRLIMSKRVDLLINAFSIVRESLDAKLIIIGDGELRHNLESKINRLGMSDVVSFTGFVDNVSSYLANANALVLSSDWEGLPSVLIEALEVGLQCVSTDCPSGPREILLNGKVGFLSKVGDDQALALNMIEAIVKPLDLSASRLERFENTRVAINYLDLMK